MSERLEKEFDYVPTDLGELESFRYRLERIETVLKRLLRNANEKDLSDMGLTLYEEIPNERKHR